jgi:Tfp pilus assembly protein PilO
MFLGGAGAVGYQSQQLEREHQKVKTLRAEARDEASVQAELEQSKQKLEQCKTDLNHLELGVPDFAYVPTFLEDLAKCGQSNGIEVTGVRPLPNPPAAKDAPAQPRKAYEELNIEVKGRGDYASVRRFLSALNTFPKIVAAKAVTLTPPNATDPRNITDKLEIIINLKAFVFATPGGNKGGTAKNG